MLHSTLRSKRQTTIPEKIRKALRIKPGDKLEYEVDGRASDRSCASRHSVAQGALASKKGKGMTLAEIREGGCQ
ncbi:MAG: AbrB/MazE/SpoVT family DNA-binding domain-containing protein [Candidatus Sulfotelmatobacter sp.]